MAKILSALIRQLIHCTASWPVCAIEIMWCAYWMVKIWLVRIWLNCGTV